MFQKEILVQGCFKFGLAFLCICSQLKIICEKPPQIHVSDGHLRRLHLTSVMITKNRSPGPHPGRGGSGVGQGVSRPTPRGLSRPTPRRSSGPHPGGLQAHTQRVSRPTPGARGMHSHTWGSRPRPWRGCLGPGPGGVYLSMRCGRPHPSRWLLLQAVRILLECILV